MKLAICILHNRDRNRISDELTRAGFKFTVLSSTGGFLREGNTTLMVGLNDDEVTTLRELMSEFCSSREQMLNVASYEANPTAALLAAPVKVPVGGAVMFLMPVEEFHRF
jgi:uncharacterized protein YaaQ